MWCLFPETLGTPGPKPRPALVLQVFDDDAPEFWVQAVYGTSQKVNKLYRGEFLISNTNVAAFRLAGLSYPTKFDFKHRLDLPYNNEWFGVAPASTVQNPVLGTLHSSLVKAAASAFQVAT